MDCIDQRDLEILPLGEEFWFGKGDSFFRGPNGR